MIKTPYLVGRRTNIAKPVTKSEMQDEIRASEGDTTNKTWPTLGWSAATFGAGAILGWMTCDRLIKK